MAVTVTAVTLPSTQVVGPFLRFGNYDPQSKEYTASVLLVLHPTVADQPSVNYEAEAESPVEAESILLDTFEGFKCWRFNFSIILGPEERSVPYTVVVGDSQVQYAFVVPGASQPWRWAFWSCNGFHEPSEGPLLDGIQPLWTDFNIQNKAKPFHVNIYNDPVWKIQTLLDWLKIEKMERLTTPPTEACTLETNSYYFAHYCEHFSEPEFRDALASVPYIFSWDDHDIFDGYGSYPPTLQYCPVFNMTFGAAKRFYLLFQQHATEATIGDLNGTWGGQGGYNEMKRLGSSVVLWTMDNRTERTRDQIVSKETHDLATQALLQLGEEVRHVVVLATVPLVFPELPAEGIFCGIQGGQGIWGIFNESGLGASLMNQFGEPDLLDDIIDHWSSKEHQAERIYLVSNMQRVAKQRKIRVTFISGDVHSAGIGRFYSYPKKAGEDFREDFRFMPNITSSAMGNTPMPAGLVATYNSTNRAGTIPGMGPTREKMVRRFHGGNDKVYGCRNYCTVDEVVHDPSRCGKCFMHIHAEVCKYLINTTCCASNDENNGALHFCLRGEDRRQKGKVDVWDNMVPCLTNTEDKWGGAEGTANWSGTQGVGRARGSDSDDDEEHTGIRRLIKPPSFADQKAKAKQLMGKLGGMFK